MSFLFLLINKIRTSKSSHNKEEKMVTLQVNSKTMIVKMMEIYGPCAAGLVLNFPSLHKSFLISVKFFINGQTICMCKSI